MSSPNQNVAAFNLNHAELYTLLNGDKEPVRYYKTIDEARTALRSCPFSWSIRYPRAALQQINGGNKAHA